MAIDIDATYRDGAIHPDTPLSLPNETPVRVRVLPVDFSREDIYSDRD